MGTVDFRELREVLRNLSLQEVDFAAGDADVSRLADFKQATNRLDTTGEPWVAEWLSAEHLKAVMLHTAAITNWRKEQSEGADQTFNSRNRGVIVGRFNAWVTECQSRLDTYERSARTPFVVAEWRAGLERFRQDPVHNP